MSEQLKIGNWIIADEDGIVDLIHTQFLTKREAVLEASDITMDPKPKPRVKRIAKGEYEYFPYDADAERYRESSYIIKKLTPGNIRYYQEQLDEDTPI